MREMIPLEEARALVCGAVEKLPVETVELLDAVGRVVAADQASDIDVAPFAHSAMDGFALRAAEIAEATEEAILDSLFKAEGMRGHRGAVPALPVEEVLRLLRD